ncbi:hypothetical protein [Pseudoduganella sp. RAF53_2]|jgi:RNA polymerase sigma-70 factor (ECF subfamily)|uniref:hypothetical protein n=1 Tax=unclassified Pseudoduganella TaxID=2637179 RepID=UPI003F9E1C98
MAPEALTGKQLDELRSALRNYVRKHFPGLHDEADDLTAQAISDLWEYLEKRGEIPDQPAIRKIGYAILKRRAADIFRKPARDWAMSLDNLSEAEQADPAQPDAWRAALHRRMLHICVAELADASQEDDLLLSMVAGTGPDQKDALDARTRQRLHRLRARLAEAIRRELGEDAKKLLKDSV